MMSLHWGAIGYADRLNTSRTAWSFVSSTSMVASVSLSLSDPSRKTRVMRRLQRGRYIKYSKGRSNRVHIILLFRGGAPRCAFDASTPRCTRVARISFSYERIENICRRARINKICALSRTLSHASSQSCTNFLPFHFYNRSFILLHCTKTRQST